MPNQKIITLDNLSLQEFDNDSELIPLLTPEDEEEMNNEQLPDQLPILPLRNTVLFPGVVIPITAGRDKSIKLINDANAGGKVIGVVSQINEEDEDPSPEDINKIGTVARILRVLKMPDGNVTVILQGKKRFEIDAVTSEQPYLKATIKEVPEKRPDHEDAEFATIIESVKDLAIQIIKESPNIPTEATFAIKNIESKSFLINFVSSNMNLSVKEKQDLLIINDLKERALSTLRYMNVELQKLELKNDIQSKVRFDLDQQQREYFLHQQMKTIQEELGGVSQEEEIDEMRQKGLKKKWNEKTKNHFEKELSKMQRMNPQSPDFGIQRNYLELYLSLINICNDCKAPTNIRATRSATNNSIVNLNWTAAGTATSWEIEYGIRGFSLGSGTIIQTNQTSNQISNLQANVNYDFYVRSVCSPTQITASSGPFTVTSVTSPVTYSFMNANVNGVQYNGMKPYFYPVAGVNASLEFGSRVLSFQGHSNPLSTASNNFVEITVKLPETFWQPGTYVLEGEGAAFQENPKPAVNLIIVQGSNTFEVFENEIPGTITILEFNSTTKRIRGTFNFKYNLVENGVTTGPFNVTNGTFDFPVDDEVFQ